MSLDLIVLVGRHPRDTRGQGYLEGIHLEGGGGGREGREGGQYLSKVSL